MVWWYIDMLLYLYDPDNPVDPTSFNPAWHAKIAIYVRNYDKMFYPKG